MTHADGCYVGKRVKLELLGADEIRQIHESTLDVIENIGVMFHSQNALDVLQEHGATVDRETTVAKIPGEVVEKALATVPHAFTLGGRTTEYDLPLDGEHVYISSDGCGLSYRDPVTGEVLPPGTSLSAASDQGWLTISSIAGGTLRHVAVPGPAVTVTQDGLTPQTIAFGPLSNQPFGSAPFPVGATASSGLAPGFASDTPAVPAGDPIAIGAAVQASATPAKTRPAGSCQ